MAKTLSIELEPLTPQGDDFFWRINEDGKMVVHGFATSLQLAFEAASKVDIEQVKAQEEAKAKLAREKSYWIREIE